MGTHEFLPGTAPLFLRPGAAFAAAFAIPTSLLVELLSGFCIDVRIAVKLRD